MRLVRFAAAVVAAATFAVAGAGVTPASAVTESDEPQVLVTSLQGLWAEDQALDAQLAAATHTLTTLDALIGRAGTDTARTVYARVAAQDSAVRALEARHAVVAEQIDVLKAWLARQATQPSTRPVVTATTAAEFAALNADVAGDPRWAAFDAALSAIPYPVRTLGVRIVFGYHPEIGRAWGVYDREHNTIYIGEDAFATDARLRYVAAHEFGHAYEELRMDDATRNQAYAIVTAASSASRAEELVADTIATLWGAGSGVNYWAPPVRVTQAIALLVR